MQSPSNISADARSPLFPLQEAILRAARLCKFLNRVIVQDEFYPNDKDGSVARDALRRLIGRLLLDRVEIRPNDYVVQTAPVYVPTEAGCCMLATQTGDMSLLLDRRPTTTSPQNFPHNLAVTRLLLELQRAFAGQTAVELRRMLTEHCIINAEEPDASKRRRLATVVGKGARNGDIVNDPDFATLVRVGTHTRLYLWDYETGSAHSPSRVAARKAPGLHLLHQTGQFRELMGETAKDVRGVFVVPNAGWVEALRRSLRDKPGAELWLVVARGDLRRDGAFFHRPVFWPVIGDQPRPFLRAQLPLTAPPGSAPLACP